MKIALVSDWCAPRKGGIETHLIALSKALSERSIESIIVTSYPGDPIVEGVQIERLDVSIVPFAKIAFSPFLVQRIQDFFEKHEFDAIHIHPSIVAPVCFAAIPAARNLNLPTLATFHSIMKTLPTGLRISNSLFGWSNENFHLSAVSKRIARQLLKVDKRKKIQILPNGFDRYFWAHSLSPEPIGEYGKIRLVTSMRLQARKRPYALLKIFKQASEMAREEGIELDLVIAGDGSARRKMERSIKQLQLSENCCIAGWLNREQLRSLYWQSDIYVMPSIKEAFCIAALEARATGLPVVARQGTGIEDYIEDQKNGLLVDSDISMARALVGLAVDEMQRRNLTQFDCDLDEYSWSEIGKRHEQAYRTIISDQDV